MEATTIEPTIKEEIEQILGSPLSQTEDLLGAGILDSLNAVQLIEALEEKFDISVPVEEFTQENLDSVSALAALVEKYQENGQ